MPDLPASAQGHGAKSETPDPDINSDFIRYRQLGAYHWDLNSRHPFKSNAFVRARYNNVLALAGRFTPGGLAGKRVLDHGCGDGVLTAMLARKGARATGLDTSRLALGFARERTAGLGIRYQCGSAYQLPYPDGAFDTVLSTQVIEHLDAPEAMLAEIRRVLKKGGCAIVTTRIKLSETPTDPTHVTEWFENEFLELIESVFDKGTYFHSHPVCWMEASHRFPLLKYLINLVSLIRNPYEGFESRFRFFVLQYAVVFK